MKIIKSNRNQFKDWQITDESQFLSRRQLIKSAAASSVLTSTSLKANVFDWFSSEKTPSKTTDKALKKLTYSQTESGKDLKLTPEQKVTTYNNFYEFGTSKQAPAEYAHQFNPTPWQLTIDGLVEKPLTLNYDDLLTEFPLEERVYRLRCVEAWSMVIPWIGFPLSQLLNKAHIKSKAKYVAFESIYRPEELRGQSSRFIGGNIQFPYTEGLRLDEAMHPLTILAVGLYGKTLPNQNGAPIRLVVPWKYGFKNIKSIVRISLTDKRPPTTWNLAAPNEYGFYANVNPNVDHPRWSQAQERVITSGGVFNQSRQDTLLFNGYEEVASLYSDMDLSKQF